MKTIKLFSLEYRVNSGAWQHDNCTGTTGANMYHDLACRMRSGETDPRIIDSDCHRVVEWRLAPAGEFTQN